MQQVRKGRTHGIASAGWPLVRGKRAPSTPPGWLPDCCNRPMHTLAPSEVSCHAI